MSCHIAENRPLSLLRDFLGIPTQCHSFRTTCTMKRVGASGDVTLGAPGAVIGYCQALFNYQGSARLQSEHVLNVLRSINAPWWASHELFWGFRNSETPAEYVREGMHPLKGFGRVPVLITGLDPERDLAMLREICVANAPIAEGETILIRTALGSRRSAELAGEWLKEMFQTCVASGRMPAWWPLFQSSLGSEVWDSLKERSGEAWTYANVAVNPFSHADVYTVARENITVAQITIGLAEGMSDTGIVRLAPGMKILGAPQEAEWQLSDYLARLSVARYLPTLIVLGPSQPSWTECDNRQRLERFVPLLISACQNFWSDVPADRKNMILTLSA